MPSCNRSGLDAVTPDRSALAEPQSAFQPCHHRCFIAQAAVKGVVISRRNDRRCGFFCGADVKQEPVVTGHFVGKTRIASRHGAPRITACSGANSLRHRLTRPYLGWRASPAFPAWPPDRFLPMRPGDRERFRRIKGGKLLGQPSSSHWASMERSDPARRGWRQRKSRE